MTLNAAGTRLPLAASFKTCYRHALTRDARHPAKWPILPRTPFRANVRIADHPPTLLAAVDVGRVALVFNGRDKCGFNGEVADLRLRETDNSSSG